MVTTRRSYPQTAADLWPNLSPIARTTGTVSYRPFTFGLHAAEDHSYWARLAEGMQTALQVRCDSFATWQENWTKIGQRIRGLYMRAIELAEANNPDLYLADACNVDDRPNVVTLGCQHCGYLFTFGSVYSQGHESAYAAMARLADLDCPQCDAIADLESGEPYEDEE